MLGINNPARTLSVGSGGQFSTIQAAIDFIEAQNDCFIEVETSHTDYQDIGGGVFVGISVESWAQDSNIINMNVGVGATDITRPSRNLWLGVNSETRLYPFIGAKDSLSNIGYVDCNRIEASIAAASNEAFTLYRENPYVIELLDSVYTEIVTIDAPLCIIFEGQGKANWYRPDSATSTSCIVRGVNFTHGVIDFSHMVMTNSESGSFLRGGGGASNLWDANIPANYNTIALRIHNETLISVTGTDFMSPNIALGNVLINNIKIDHSATSVLAHMFVFSCRGSLSVNNVQWNCTSLSANSDFLLLDGSQARKIRVNNIDTDMYDPLNGANAWCVVQGGKFCNDIRVSNVTFATNGTLSTLGSNKACAVNMDSGITAVPAVSSGNVNVSNITFNAPNALDADLFAYMGLVGQTTTVSASNINGGIMFNAGLDAITFVPQTLVETV